MAPSCQLSVRVRGHRQKNGREGKITHLSQGIVRSEGVSFFSRVIFGHWICVLICVLSGGIHPYAAYCVRGCVDGMKSGVKEEDQ